MNGRESLAAARVRAASAVIALAVCAPLSGCIVVVSDEGIDHWSDDSAARRWPRIGIELAHVDAALARHIGVSGDRASLVERVVPGSPAERAGVQRYDVVTAVNESDDASPARLRRAIRERSPTDPLRLAVLREGKPLEVAVPPGDWPDRGGYYP